MMGRLIFYIVATSYLRRGRRDVKLRDQNVLRKLFAEWERRLYWHGIVLNSTSSIWILFETALGHVNFQSKERHWSWICYTCILKLKYLWQTCLYNYAFTHFNGILMQRVPNYVIYFSLFSVLMQRLLWKYWSTIVTTAGQLWACWWSTRCLKVIQKNGDVFSFSHFTLFVKKKRAHKTKTRRVKKKT